MAVGVQDQFPAVPVPLPLRDHLHIDTTLNRSRDEHAAERTLTVGRQGQPFARIRKRLAGISDLKQAFIVRFALTQSFNQGPGLRVNRNCKALVSLVPINNDLCSGEIDIAALDRG